MLVKMAYLFFHADGKEYYYNVETGVSQWDAPQMTKSKDDSNKKVTNHFLAWAVVHI